MSIPGLYLPGLTFENHPFGFRGYVNFPNGFGLSVVPESDEKTYEVAVMLNGAVCYTSGLTEDVFRYLGADSVNDLAIVVEAL